MFFLFFLTLVAPLWAGENPEETAIDKPGESGGFGGPVLKVTGINDVFGLIVGGRGGWISKQTFAIGGGFYGLLRDIETEDSGFERDFEFAYGGLELEYIIAPRQVVHVSVQTLIGFGGLTDRHQNLETFDRFDEFDRFGGPDDTFFIVEPALNIMWNMKTYLRIGFGGSYRFIRGVGITGLHNSDLSGSSVVVTFKFGRFGPIEVESSDTVDW